jgi:O-antigen/teichoic acid export membrane protein
MSSRMLKGGAWLSAGNALSAIFGFLRNIAIARLVSVSDFGVVVLLSMIVSVVELVSNLAIDRLLIQAPDGDDRKLQATAHVLQVVRGVIGGALVLALASTLARLFHVPDATWAFQVLALVPVIRGFSHLDTVRVQREMVFHPTFWVLALPAAISVAVAVPLAYWQRDYSAIVWAMLAQTLAQSAITHFMATRRYEWAWSRELALRILAFGWPLLANGLLMFVVFQGDKAVIAAAFTPEVVGWYGAAFMLCLTPAMLATSILQGLLLPVMSRHQHDPAEFVRHYARTTQVCMGLGLALAIILVVWGPDLLVLLFGQRYEIGVGVLMLLGIAQGIRLAKAGEFVSSIALARTKDPLVANVARGAALPVAIGFVMIGYGPMTLAAAGICGELVSYFVSIRLLAKLQATSGGPRWPVFVISAALVGLSWAISSNLRSEVSVHAYHAIALVWFLFSISLFVTMSQEVRTLLGQFVRQLARR